MAYVCGNDLMVCLCVQMMPLTTNLSEAYKHGRDDEQNFIQNLALFLVTILKEHGSKLFETDQVKVSFTSEHDL